MVKKRIFVSHSHDDQEFILKMKEKITSDEYWIDYWDLKPGDSIIDKIEEAIEESATFLVILSKNSVNSKWVKFELNMAIFEHLRRDLHIVGVRIDDCDVPLRVKQFLYIDKPNDDLGVINDIVEFIDKRIHIFEGPVIRKSFVNRNDEIKNFEDAVNNPDIKVLFVNGLFGMGKSAFINEAIDRIFLNANIAKINCSKAHVGSRLAMEMSAIAGIPPPIDGAKKEDIMSNILLSTEKILNSTNILILDDFENVVDDGIIYDDFLKIMNHVIKIDFRTKNAPVIIISRTRIDVPINIKKFTRFISIRDLNESSVASIIKLNLQLSSTKEHAVDDIRKLAESLGGSPLAAKLVVPLIDRFSASYIIDNVKYLKELKVDLARELLTNISPDNESLISLQLLAIVNLKMNLEDIIEATGYNLKKMLEIMEKLTLNNLIEFDGKHFYLHPILVDFFERQVVNIPNYKQIINACVSFTKKRLDNTNIGTQEHVLWFTTHFRLLLLNGDFKEALSLRRDLGGEIRKVIRDLHNREDYSLSLKYCEIYLEGDPNDLMVLYYKARGLARLGNYGEALKILDDLITREKTDRYLHAKGTVLRLASRFIDAIKVFEEILSKDPQHVASLRDMSDCHLRLGDPERAKYYIEKAWEIQPTNPFVLTLRAEIYEKSGDVEKAILDLEKSLKVEPKEKTFCRVGSLFERLGNIPKSLYYYEEAIKINPNSIDGHLHLASILCDKRDIKRADESITKLEALGIGRREIILETIKIKRMLIKGEIEQAKEGIMHLLKRRDCDTSVYGTAAEIYYELSKKEKAKGNVFSAQDNIKIAIGMVNKSLELDPKNERSKAMLMEFKKELESISK